MGWSRHSAFNATWGGFWIGKGLLCGNAGRVVGVVAVQIAPFRSIPVRGACCVFLIERSLCVSAGVQGK